MLKEAEAASDQPQAILLWSGGLDSTYLLWKFLERQSIEGVSYRRLKVIQANWTNQSGYNEFRQAREAIKKILHSKYGRSIDSLVEFVDSHDITLHSPVVGAGGLSQPMLWLMLGLYCASEKDTIIFGYIKTDCFWHVANDFGMAAFHLQKIMGKQDVRLSYPLEWVNKHEIIRKFKNSAPEIYNACWYCEDGSYEKNRTCNKCDSCIIHRVAELYNIEDQSESDSSGVMRLEKSS